MAKWNSGKPTIVLVLQGGGALGAYHIGAYQALQENGFEPDWVTGISIGAINSAILAGNQPADRLTQLEALWQDMSRPDGWGAVLSGQMQRAFNTYSNWEALMFGQPNFFTPRFPGPYLAPEGSEAATSFYDTSPLRATLERLARFELINAGATRLSLGATNVETGDLEFFDSRTMRLGPEHVMASGSLPPGFPAVRIDGKLYWDGGCVSNTPLNAVLMDEPVGKTLVFMIDLWSASGPAPATMDDVLWRAKQIQYASRTSHGIETVATKLALRQAKGVASFAAVPEEVMLRGGVGMEIVHIVYHPAAGQIPNSDVEFSRPSIAERRAAGYADMRLALRKAGVAPLGEVVVHKVMQGEVQTRTHFTPVSPKVRMARTPDTVG